MHGRVTFPIAIACGWVLLLASRVVASEVEKMGAVGPLILRCPFAGDRREDNCSPSGADAWPLSKNCWMVIYHTRSYRIVDQERSIFYQLRDGAPDGRILRERSLGPSDQYGDKAFYKSHGHVMVWGVPKGALIAGKVPPHANLFCAKWYAGKVEIRDSARGQWHGYWVEWIQFRLNAQEDDIEILQPPEKLDCGMQPLVRPVPLNEACTEWADVCGREGGVAAVRYVFDTAKGRYRMAGAGPVAGATIGAREGSLVRAGDQWWIAARPKAPGAAWMKAANPFGPLSPPVVRDSFMGTVQRTTFLCADGQVRLFSGKGDRSVLYSWDILPGDFESRNELVVFDSRTLKMPYNNAAGRVVDCPVVVPHAGGREQYVLYRFRPKALDVPYAGAIVGDKEKDVAGVYYSKILYSKPLPGLWHFGAEPQGR